MAALVGEMVRVWVGSEQGLVGGGWWLASDEGWRDVGSDIRSVWSIRVGVRGVAWRGALSVARCRTCTEAGREGAGGGPKR